MRHTLKERLGALVLDLPRFEWALRTDWKEIKNRGEALEASDDGRGFRCKWRWTSDLHVASVFPRLGGRLMARAIGDWPIEFADNPYEMAGDVQISFVIGHRGNERLPLLFATLATIAAQRGVRCECVVVEQSVKSELYDRLPNWVKYRHSPIADPQMPYCRSWALNVGARVATGRIFVFHDGDVLIPALYASEVRQQCASGHEIVNLKRFIFYLSEAHSRQVQSELSLSAVIPPDAVLQNVEAGASVAVTRDAFFAVGGYDESFVGWGGEDNEFWERAQTRRVWPYGYLPMVHLWHAAQPRKHDPDNPTLHRYAERSVLSPRQRIPELAARPFGDPARLSVDWPKRQAI